MDKESLMVKIENAQDLIDTTKIRRDLSGSEMTRIITHAQGYLSAYEEMLAEVKGHTETASWMETICLNCEKTFKLDYGTVTLGHEEMAPHGMIPVITCPHCKLQPNKHSGRNEF